VGELVRQQQPELQKLFAEGKQVYSHSKLQSFNQCEYQYWLSYVCKPRRKGIDNIYSVAGGKLHDIIEKIYNNKATQIDLKQELDNIISDCELLGLEFPTEQIANNWKTAMYHFVNNFTKLNRKFKTEQFFVYQIFPDIYMQGYIDAIDDSDKNGEDILDWKSSSAFSGEKEKEAGRQLIIYKLAREAQGKKVNRVGWFMMKYLNLSYMQKNGKVKTRELGRHEWISKCATMFTKDLSEYGLDDIEVGFAIEDAILNNNIENFPQEIQDKYTIDDCIKWYEVTDELVDETKQYIKDTIQKINDKIDDEIDWQPIITIGEQKVQDQKAFFCNTLCSHRKDCEYLRKYLVEKEQRIEKDEYEDLF
jgi:ATP-dependent helicase/DNAse subunit B